MKVTGLWQKPSHQTVPLHLKPLLLCCLPALLVGFGEGVYTFGGMWEAVGGVSTPSIGGPWVQRFISQGLEMGSRLRPKPPRPPVLLRGGSQLFLGPATPSLARLALTSPGLWTNACPLPSHATASRAGLIDYPSLGSGGIWLSGWSEPHSRPDWRTW